MDGVLLKWCHLVVDIGIGATMVQLKKSSSANSSRFKVPGGSEANDSIRSQFTGIKKVYIDELIVFARACLQGHIFSFVPHLDTCWLCRLSPRWCSSPGSSSSQRAHAGSSKRDGLKRRMKSSAGSEEVGLRASTWSTKPSRQASRTRSENLAEV